MSRRLKRTWGRYNLSAASIALPFMQAHPFFAPPEWVHYTGLGVVFVGAVLGMLCMGYLGDLLGRRRAMLVTFPARDNNMLMLVRLRHNHSWPGASIECRW